VYFRHVWPAAAAAAARRFELDLAVSAADWNVTAGANLTVLYCGKKKTCFIWTRVLFSPSAL